MAKPKTAKEAPSKLVILRITKIQLDKDGYSKGGGRYYGVGAPVWDASLEDSSPDVDVNDIESVLSSGSKNPIRAHDKESAKAVFANYFTTRGFTVKCK